MSVCSRSSRVEAGQAIVEIALVLPILLALLVGIVDAARALQAYVTLADAVREAARDASVHGSGASVSTASATLVAGTTGPDFTLSPSPTRQSVNQGASTSYAVTIVPSGGFGGSVTLSVAGLPSGASAIFGPQPATTSSTMTVTTAASTPTGSYVLTVQGVSGSLTRTIGVGLLVQPTASPSFTLDVSPVTASTAIPGTVSYGVTITRSGGFSAPITLAVSGLPTNATAVFSPNPVTGTSTTLTITLPATSPAGDYALAISGDGGGAQQWGPAANDARVTAAVRDRAVGMVASSIAVTSSWPAGNNGTGAEVVVSATYPFRPIVAAVFGDISVPLSATTRMRIYR